MTSEQLASALAWTAVLMLVALLLLTVLQRRHVSPPEVFVILLAGLCVAIAGGLTAMLSISPRGTFDVETVRWTLIILRAIAIALYAGSLFGRIGWAPPILRRFL